MSRLQAVFGSSLGWINGKRHDCDGLEGKY
jgi:hypothetical protein